MTPPLQVRLHRLYALFRKPLVMVPSARAAIVGMVIAATLVVGLAIARVAREHEVVSLGYALARVTERVRIAEEHNRLLALERATLTGPERIRALATALGMVPTPPDQIRVVHAKRAAAR